MRYIKALLIFMTCLFLYFAIVLFGTGENSAGTYIALLLIACAVGACKAEILEERNGRHS